MDVVAFHCTIYQFSDQVVTSKLSKSESTGSLDLCFVFVLVRAENGVSHMQIVAKVTKF